MTHHILQGRSESEVTWFQRRDTLKAAAAWVAMGGLPAAMAQQRSNVVEFVGDVLVNGQRLLPQQIVQTGDEVFTGVASRVVFLIGNRTNQNGTDSWTLYPRDAQDAHNLLASADAAMYRAKLNRRTSTF